jgi:hypothetical protein
MCDTTNARTGATPSKTRLPWYVCVSPCYYDDAADTGFGWEGWAVDDDDAILQALEDCRIVNQRDPEDREDDLDTCRAKVHVAEIDFRRFAGPLLHWARSMGGFDSPLWGAMEEAVSKARLTVAPLEILNSSGETAP